MGVQHDRTATSSAATVEKQASNGSNTGVQQFKTQLMQHNSSA
jgi:hypothetical protein